MSDGSIDINDAPYASAPPANRPRSKSSPMRVVVGEPEASDGRIRCTAMLDDLELCFELDVEQEPYLSRFADPFLLVSLMRRQRSSVWESDILR